MTEATVNFVNDDQVGDTEPPRGTAIVWPLRHVRAVRECHAQRFADPARAAASRSVRAWGWALGEIEVSPVTDQMTAVPPSRAAIEAEIAVADDRRLRGDGKNRADAAATVLRWLIGDDDQVPVRVANRGELVGGFGDVVRSRDQIADVLAVAVQRQGQAADKGLDVSVGPDDKHLARQSADYFSGVAATLTWVLGQEANAPITGAHICEPTTQDLKTERVHALDVVDQAKSPWMADRLPPPWYGQGVESSITWLLGYSTELPLQRSGRWRHGSG